MLVLLSLLTFATEATPAVQAPQPKTRINPEYPTGLWSQSAVCTIELRVASDGRVTGSQAQSDEHCPPEFAASAEAATLQWAFYPLEGADQTTFRVKVQFVPQERVYRSVKAKKVTALEAPLAKPPTTLGTDGAKCLVQFKIDERGTVGDVQAWPSETCSSSQAQAAKEAGRSWTFEPYKRFLKPQAAVFVIEMGFEE